MGLHGQYLLVPASACWIVASQPLVINVTQLTGSKQFYLSYVWQPQIVCACVNQLLAQQGLGASVVHAPSYLGSRRATHNAV